MSPVNCPGTLNFKNTLTVHANFSTMRSHSEIFLVIALILEDSTANSAGDLSHGVIDTYGMDYTNGYARLSATLAQAAQLSPNCNALCIRVQIQDKQGLCHHLANENTLVWVKKDA